LVRSLCMNIFWWRINTKYCNFRGSLRWESKIWPWVLRGFHSRVTGLTRPRSNCTANYTPVLSSERELQNYKPATVGGKFQGGNKILATAQDPGVYWSSNRNKSQKQKSSVSVE
jgi:hypothetical protein